MSDPTQNHEPHHTAQGDEISEHVRLPEAGLRELVVRNAQGVIRVRGSERDDVLVHAVKGGRPDSRRYREASLLLEEHEGSIFVRPHIPGGPGWIGLGLPTGFIKRGPGRFDFDIDFDKLNFAFGSDVWFDIDIELPHRTANAAISIRNASGEVSVAGIQLAQLNVATSSGDVEVNDCQGALHIATASGDMVLREVGGDVVVTTASGDVHAGAATGRLTVRSASGDIAVDGGTLAGLHISTASGDHNATAALTSPGPYRFETVSGDVNLALSLPLAVGASEPTAWLEFSTVSGDAAIQPPFRHAGKKTWEIGASPQTGAQIRVKTVSGDCHVRAFGDAGLTAVEAPTAPIDREDEMQTGPIPPKPPMPPNPPYPSFSDAFAAAGEQIARQAEAVSQRAMQQAMDALERAAAKMRPLGTMPDDRPAPPNPAPAPPRPSTAPQPAAETSAPVSAAEPAPTLSPEAEQQRLEVLQALERGDIEIDDAMSRLDALESGTTPDHPAPEDAAGTSPETPPTP